MLRLWEAWYTQSDHGADRRPNPVANIRTPNGRSLGNSKRITIHGVPVLKPDPGNTDHGPISNANLAGADRLAFDNTNKFRTHGSTDWCAELGET